MTDHRRISAAVHHSVLGGPAEDAPTAELVHLAKLRWRIEHDYRELKHGLGPDHYEGCGYRGSHHHLTLVTPAQAFLTPAPP